MPGQKSLKEEFDKRRKEYLKQTKSPASRKKKEAIILVTLSGGAGEEVWFSLDIAGQEIVEVG